MKAALPVLVVAGAGISGARAATLAVKSGKFQVITIEPKDFVEVPYAAVRAVVDPATANRSLIPLKDIAVGNHIVGSVKQIKKSSVVLASGEEIAYDYLIVATGALYSESGRGVMIASVPTIADRKNQLLGVSEKIKAAKSIAIVGGGPVGIEVLGEILDKYAGKEITLIHSGAQLLEGKDIKMHNYLMAAMKQNKVTVLLNDRAVALDEAQHTLTTKVGKTVPAEMVIWGTGSKPNTTALVEGGDYAGAIDDKGYAKVDPFLRLQGTENVFVLGDSNDTPNAKVGYLADLQAVLAVANLIKVASGAKPAQLGRWAPPMQPKGAMFVSFGKGDGVGHAGGCVCTGWVIKNVKSKDMFVSKVRGALGVH